MDGGPCFNERLHTKPLNVSAKLEDKELFIIPKKNNPSHVRLRCNALIHVRLFIFHPSAPTYRWIVGKETTVWTQKPPNTHDAAAAAWE